MREPEVNELEKFVTEYFKKSDREGYWNMYKDWVSFPEKIYAPIIFINPLENIKQQLEEFELMLKKAEAEYRSKHRV